MVLDTLKRFVETELLDGASVEPGEELLLSGRVDSLGVVRLVVFIERTFGLKVPPGDVKLSNFGTLARVAEYVTARKAA